MTKESVIPMNATLLPYRNPGMLRMLDMSTARAAHPIASIAFCLFSWAILILIFLLNKNKILNKYKIYPRI